jgi:hypothetical protein
MALNVIFIGALIGGIGGFITGISLMLDHVLSYWRSILVITLSWMAGWVIGWGFIGIPLGGVIGGIVGGGIGGFGTAFSMWTEKVFPSWNNILIVTLGWSMGWGLVELLIRMTPQLIVIPVTVGALIGGIGGFVTIWQTRVVKS